MTHPFSSSWFANPKVIVKLSGPCSDLTDEGRKLKAKEPFSASKSIYVGQPWHAWQFMTKTLQNFKYKASVNNSPAPHKSG